MRIEKEILRTHPIPSKIEGWFIKVEEISNNAFVVEAVDRCGKTISKQGSDPEILQIEIENELCNFSSLR